MYNKKDDQIEEREHSTFGQKALKILIYISLVILGANIGANVVQTLLLNYPLNLLHMNDTLRKITALAVMVISVSALYFYMMRKRQYRGIATAVYIPYVISALLFGITKLSMV